MTARKMRQIDDYETSTRICPCGDSFTWEGYDPRLFVWELLHVAHCDEAGVDATVSEDGKRATE